MNEEELKARANKLLEDAGVIRGPGAFTLYHGALSLMIAIYGSNSIQVQGFTRDAEQIRGQYMGSVIDGHISAIATGALRNMKAELDAGFIGTVQKTITGDVLTDLVALSRHVLHEDSSDDSKNVAGVLAAASFEDTLRRLATSNGIPHFEKLADLLSELKNQGVLQGSQVGIAQSYLNFRNSALHAQWDRIDRSGVSSVLGFVEQLLLTHF